MRKKNICSVTLIIIFTLVNMQLITSQSSDFIASNSDSHFFTPKNLGFSSPAVTDFIQYGNLNVNLFNGLLSTDIDLFEYIDNDFNIPFSLRYISRGFIPFQRPSIVGQNWILNCGGVITRKINGSPDETRGYYCDADVEKYQLDGLFVAIKDNDFIEYSNNDLLNLNIETNSGGQNTPYIRGDFKYDFEPDVFYFNFGKYSGSFIINNVGEAELLTERNCVINLDGLAIQSYSKTDSPITSYIEITTPEGLKYQFGGNVSYLEYILPSNPEKCKVVPRHITSWFLKSIEAPNGRKINLSYHNVLQKNKYHSLAYSFSDNEIYSVPINEQSLQPSFNSGTSLLAKDYIMEDRIYTPIIDSLWIGHTCVKFETNRTDSGFYDRNIVEDKSVILSSVKQYYGNTIVNSVDFEYLFRGSYHFLSSVQKNNQLYSFEYDLENTLPKPLTLSVDHWGFWSGRYETSVANDTVAKYCVRIQQNRAVNPSVCDIGLLTKIEYPTGGHTEIEYESNRYKIYGERNLNSIMINLVTSGNITYCGGARVKSIKDFEDITQSYSNVRSFFYKDSLNGNENGILRLKPKYETNENIVTEVYNTRFLFINPIWKNVTFRDQTSSSIKDISANSYGQNSFLPEYHISYPDVIEVNFDNGFNHYHYSSYTEIPDKYDVTIFDDINSYYLSRYTNFNEFQVAEKYGLYFTNDMSHYRGKLLTKKSYNEQHVLINSETNTYNTSSSENEFNISIKSVPHGCAVYKMYLTPCLLLQQNITNGSNVSTILNYTYNNKNMLSEKTITNSDGRNESIMYKYPFDFQPNGSDDNTLAIAEMNNKNIISDPIEAVKTITANGSKMAKEGIMNKYFIANNLPLKKSVFELETSTLLTPYSDSYYSSLKEKEVFHTYNVNGYPVYIEMKDGTKMVYLWSKGSQNPDVKIEGLEYSQVVNTLTQSTISSMESTDFYENPTQRDNLLQTIRTQLALPNVFVTTYIYKPLVGITSVTDPHGLTTTYEYDTFNRLVCIKDPGGKIVKKMDYHYAE